MGHPTRVSKSARPAPYDSELLDNWTLARLKMECKWLDLNFSSNARRPVLMRLLKEHERVMQRDGDSPNETTLSHSAPLATLDQIAQRSTRQDGGPEPDSLELVMNNVLDALGSIERRLEVLERRDSTAATPATAPPASVPANRISSQLPVLPLQENVHN